VPALAQFNTAGDRVTQKLSAHRTSVRTMTNLTDFSDDEVADAITTWAGRIAAGEARLLRLIGEFDRREAWSRPGLLSCAHWLSWITHEPCRRTSPANASTSTTPSPFSCSKRPDGGIIAIRPQPRRRPRSRPGGRDRCRPVAHHDYQPWHDNAMTAMSAAEDRCRRYACPHGTGHRSG